jgi:hypothetical protein
MASQVENWLSADDAQSLPTLSGVTLFHTQMSCWGELCPLMDSGYSSRTLQTASRAVHLQDQGSKNMGRSDR